MDCDTLVQYSPILKAELVLYKCFLKTSLTSTNNKFKKIT